MKKVQITILLLMGVLLLSSCWDKWTQEETVDENSKIEQKTEVTKEQQKKEETDSKKSLKTSTNKQLDDVLQKELETVNTASSDFLFFEQMTSKTATIEEVKESWWLEITRGEVYNYWEKEWFTIVYDLLSEEDRKYVFYRESDIFFYISSDYRTFLRDIKSKIWNYTLLSEDDMFIDLSFNSNNKKYFVNIMLSWEEDRDDMDRILDLREKAKVSIFIWE